MKHNNKILISSSVKKDLKESIALAKELNVGVEISRLPIYKTPQLTLEQAIGILKDALNGFNNRITLHAMFSDVNIAGQDLLLREVSQKRLMQSFEVGKALKVDTILFHTGNKGTKHSGSIYDFKKNFIAYWKEFIKEFEKANITAVLENVFEDTPEFCYDLFEGINSPNLKLALDTGHVNLYAPKTNIIDWINLYGENLYHMHIHNNFQTNDDHSNLQNGTLNFERILTTIKEKQLNPSFVFEMFTEEDIRKSLDYFNKLMF